jgi:phenylalanyl-tRNA synthetase beta chain
MKVTLNWLKEYVDFTFTPEELSERLTMLGLEVEGVEKIGGEFEGVIVAEVLTREKHPNADKLSVCQVADGQGSRQIVCGAQNFKAGDKVPLILPGSTLPPKQGDKAPFVIQVGKIRGIESHGMMCSATELGLPPGEDGLLILPQSAVVGQPFAEHLGRAGSDTVYDLEVTPNRPDLSSVIGIAREIAAITGNPLRLPTPFFASTPAAGTGETPAVEGILEIQIDAPDLCPRYTARVLQGIRVGPSPDWLRNTLEKVGLRSVNNVVDITNYVMLETGQPLHAFDFDLIAKGSAGKPRIVVRRAAEGESFQTLDGKSHTLSAEMLLIADSDKGIAIAGVMGGANTEIQPDTQNVLLESAYFEPTHIRRTSKRLGIRTDASYRYERGADVEATDFASRRAAELILRLAGGQRVDGSVDAHPQPKARRTISLRHHKVNELLGIQLKPGEIEYYLGQLGLKQTQRHPRAIADTGPIPPSTFEIPGYRVDLKREADLIEEVCRMHGVDKIPASPPRGALGFHSFDAVFDDFAAARRILTGLGLDEAQGQTLVGGQSASRTGLPGIIELANPLSSGMNVLRPSLLPGLLDSLQHNLSRRNSNVQLFEIGRVFSAPNGTPIEGWRVGFAVTGLRNAEFWSGSEREAKVDLFDLKGILEEFLDQLGLRGVTFAKASASSDLFLEYATIAIGGKFEIGRIGQLLPTLARTHDLRDPVFLAELDLGVVLKKGNRNRSFKALPQYPSVRRDLALVVGDGVKHDEVLTLVRQTKTPILSSVDLFDVYRGQHVPEGHKSVAYAFTYRAADRTLKDEEVNAAHAKITELLQRSLGATMRT